MLIASIIGCMLVKSGDTAVQKSRIGLVFSATSLVGSPLMSCLNTPSDASRGRVVAARRRQRGDVLAVLGDVEHGAERQHRARVAGVLAERRRRAHVLDLVAVDRRRLPHLQPAVLRVLERGRGGHADEHQHDPQVHEVAAVAPAVAAHERDDGDAVRPRRSSRGGRWCRATAPGRWSRRRTRPARTSASPAASAARPARRTAPPARPARTMAGTAKVLRRLRGVARRQAISGPMPLSSTSSSASGTV